MPFLLRAVSAARHMMFLLALALLGGCAAKFETVSFNQAANPELQQIYTVPMRESELRAFISGNPGYSFGLIGAVIAESDIASKSRHIQDHAESLGFDHRQLFADTLSSAMEERGYRVHWPSNLEEAKPNRIRRDNWGFQKTYGSLPGADAILDMNFSFIGYASAGSGLASPYRPTIVLNVRMLSPDSEQVLFAEQIAYHNILYGAEDSITLEPVDGFAYPSFDDLANAENTIVEGLELAVIAVAEELARQFPHK